MPDRPEERASDDDVLPETTGQWAGYGSDQGEPGDAEVVLQGSVSGEAARRRAELIARGAPGVRGVRNELDVRQGELEPPEERGHAA